MQGDSMVIQPGYLKTTEAAAEAAANRQIYPGVGRTLRRRTGILTSC